MSQTQLKAVIFSIRDSGMRIKDASKDLRGRDVIDRNGEKMGMINDLLMDDKESRIRFIQIAHGGALGLAQEEFILPVNTIMKIEDRQVHVDRVRDDIVRASQYAPELEKGMDTENAGWFEQGPGSIPGAPVQ